MAKILYGDRIGQTGRLSIGCSGVLFNAVRDKILLTQRQDNGRWCLPGGHMEAGESVTEACIREVWEETGLQVHVKRLIGIYSSPHMLLTYADGNSYQMVGICCEVEQSGGELHLSEETTGYGYFSLAEIALMDVMEHHLPRIKDAFAGGDVALL